VFILIPCIKRPYSAPINWRGVKELSSGVATRANSSMKEGGLVDEMSLVFERRLVEREEESPEEVLGARGMVSSSDNY